MKGIITFARWHFIFISFFMLVSCSNNVIRPINKIIIDGGMPNVQNDSIDELLNYITFCYGPVDSAKDEIIRRGKNQYVTDKLNDYIDKNKNCKCRFLIEGILLFENDNREERIKYIFDQIDNNPNYDYTILKYLDSEKDVKYIEKLISLTNERTDFRKKGIIILSYFPKNKDVRSYLFSLLSVDDEEIRQLACISIGEFALNNYEIICNNDILNALRKALNDENSDVRSSACYALKYHIKCSGVEEILFNIYKNDKNGNVRFASLNAISVIDPDITVPILIDWLKSDEYRGYCINVLELLGGIGLPAMSAIPVIKEKYFNSDINTKNNPNYMLEFYTAYQAIKDITGEEPEIPNGWELWVAGKKVGKYSS